MQRSCHKICNSNKACSVSYIKDRECNTNVLHLPHYCHYTSNCPLQEGIVLSENLKAESTWNILIHKIQFPKTDIQSLREPNIDLVLGLKVSLLRDTADTCPSPGSSLLSAPDLRQTLYEIEETDVSWLTVQLVWSALSVRGLGGQELVVQIAVWGGRFVVRPEFCCAHVAAQGEQRLAQLPCNHRDLEGAGSPGGKQGGGKKRENTPG